MKTFFILWHPQGTTPPTVMFAGPDEARKTGESMMKRIGTGTMYVMEAVGGIQIEVKTKWQNATEERHAKVSKKAHRR